MAIMQLAIKENDVVELARPFGKWPAGRLGAVVSDYGDVKLVEIADGRGQMLDLIQVPVSELELIVKYGG